MPVKKKDAGKLVRLRKHMVAGVQPHERHAMYREAIEAVAGPGVEFTVDIADNGDTVVTST